MNVLITLLKARLYASVLLGAVTVALVLFVAGGGAITLPPVPAEPAIAAVLDDPTPTVTPTVTPTFFVDPRCPDGDCPTETPTPTATHTSTATPTATSTVTPTPTNTPVVTADDMIEEPPPNWKWFFPRLFRSG